jgi:peptidyl-dipeptidase Dcp
MKSGSVGRSMATTPASSPVASNPFFDRSPLQYEAPPFDLIHDGDYPIAIDEGMKRQLAEIEQIATQADAPTLDNTVAAMERSGALLTRVLKAFFAVTKANTNETLQKVEADVAPRLAAHQDAIFLDPRLFARVQSLYDDRDGLDAESKYVVERYHLNFVRAGARLSEADKTELRALNKEASSLSTEFDNKLLAATKAGALVTGKVDDLAGLRDGDLAAAAEAAKGRQRAGAWVLTLQNTTQQPAQVTLQSRTTRERLYRASTERAEHDDANDTRAVVRRLAELRARRAELLGYPTYAAYALDDQMAKTPEAAIKLLTDIAPVAIAKAHGEAEKMQELVDAEKGDFRLAPWDWQYYAEQVRKAEYALDDAQIRPYLELDRVLRDGVFFAANQLYGLTFEERHDLPVYHPDVRVFEVKDESAASFALFYADYFRRDAKSGGAWMGSFVDASGLLGTHPVVYNVCNFTKPAPGQPALLSFDDVVAMFHEFGHALHALSSKVKYPTLAGTNVPRDFVEFPSQFNENWAAEPTVFAHYARHYRTGAPMPHELVEKVKRARKFNQGFATTEYLAAALLDMAWHTLPGGAPEQNVNDFEAEALARFKVDFALVPPRYRSSYFAHIWGGGYGAGYYAYLWSEVLDHDAFQWFATHGGMTRANGQRFRDMVLSRGDTQEMASLYRAFRGRDPSVEPLLDHRGLAPAKA